MAFYFQPIDRGGLYTYVANWTETYVGSGFSCVLVSNELGLLLNSQHPKSRVHFNAFERSSIAAKAKFGPGFARILRRSLLLANPIIFFINFARQISLLKKVNPEACIAFNGGHTADESCLSLLFAARILRIPCALVVLGSPRKRRWILHVYDRLLDKCLTFAKVIVTNAKHIAEHPRILSSSKNVQMITILNPAPTTTRLASPPSKRALKAVVVSRLDSGKGIETAVRAISALEPSTVSRLEIIGEGLLRNRLEDLVEELNENRRIHFLGQLAESSKQEKVASADLILCPSENEGLPFSVMEAMASGVPLVCTSIPGHLELVSDGVHALTFPPGNFRELGQKIVEILNDRGLAMKRASEAREAVREMGSTERFAREIRKVDLVLRR